jgi:hypothetical protein
VRGLVGTGESDGGDAHSLRRRGVDLSFDHREVAAGDEAEDVGGNRLSAEAEAQGEGAVDGHVLGGQDADDVSEARDDRTRTHPEVVAGVGYDDDGAVARTRGDHRGVCGGGGRDGKGCQAGDSYVTG